MNSVNSRTALQQVKSKLVQSNTGLCCNYDNDYYGDQKCIAQHAAKAKPALFDASTSLYINLG